MSANIIEKEVKSDSAALARRSIQTNKTYKVVKKINHAPRFKYV